MGQEGRKHLEEVSDQHWSREPVHVTTGPVRALYVSIVSIYCRLTEKGNRSSCSVSLWQRKDACHWISICTVQIYLRVNDFLYYFWGKAEMDGGGKQKVVRLKAIEATPSNFKEYGQVVGPSPDGAEYGPLDAQLELHRGIPRFYIMHLEDRALSFDRITHHANVTQCLGSVGGRPWYLGVARSSIVKTELGGLKSEDMQDGNTDESIEQPLQGKVLLSKAGHYYVPPAPEDVQVFRVDGPCFLKLDVGTWHAGPLFKEPSMDFYNLELSNTNVVDHTMHVFSKKDGLVFVIED